MTAGAAGAAVTVDAPAKINLFLSVGTRRAGGLHELVSVMQAITLADELTLTGAEHLQVTIEPPGVVPADGSNLVARAATTFALLRGREPAVGIHVHKRIPVAAGLGGGSADAAATLIGLKELWRAAVSRKALERVAQGIGSDVPFCVRGGTAVVEGTGEQLISLPVRTPLWWVLGIAEEGLSTGTVYERFDRLGGGGLGDPSALADALAKGDLDRVAAELRNDLGPAAVSLAPAIAGGGEALLRAGAIGALVSGSGPTWIGLVRDERHAHAVADGCAGAFARVEVASSLGRGPRVGASD